MRRNGKRTGFTLVEVMIAVVLFSVGMVGIYRLMGTLIRVNALADSVSVAAAHAEAKIEELRAQEFADIATGSDAVGGFARNWTFSTNGLPRYGNLSVTVEWATLDGIDQQVTVNTIVAAE
ncbi:MAG: prepilin-type N-terminal cleavage/methylation domain-containing protein [Lentisphaerae bacterium]|nr:prepilin-type N-terminal cleavage/methylation domain-containing protein [Lentisphaerota bacterium]